MFASMLGFILTLVILFFITMAIIASMISFANNKTVEVADNSVLVMKLDKPVYDRAPKNPISLYSPDAFELNQYVGLDEIIKDLKKAKADDRIRGIFLNLSMVPSGMATLEEIRDAITDFKTGGKFVIAYSQVYSQKAYYLATVADKVYMEPDGLIDFKGLSAQIGFIKGLLDKLDINMQVIRHGKFKSAVEPLIDDKMSKPNREQMQALVDDIWGSYLDVISDSRHIDKKDLNLYADSLLAYSADKALELHLVDGLLYNDEILDQLKQLSGISGDSKIKTVSIGKYTDATDPAGETYSKDKIAVIYAIGDIAGGKGNDLNIGSERLSEAIRKARENDKVKAIVMRVNSPGGDALAAEVIRREVELAAAEKPFVVSMGDVAASGGYWISCSANKIIADPTTITGSIGVFGVIPDFGKMMKNKLGITFDEVQTNENSGFPNVMQPLSSYETAVIQKEIEGIYSKFLHLVSKGRNMSIEQVDEIGQGRVWSAIAAKRIGLVDELGGLDKAIHDAADLAGLETYKIISLPVQKDPFQQLMEQLTGDVRTNLVKSELGYEGYTGKVTLYDYNKLTDKTIIKKRPSVRAAFFSKTFKGFPSHFFLGCICRIHLITQYCVLPAPVHRIGKNYKSPAKTILQLLNIFFALFGAFIFK